MAAFASRRVFPFFRSPRMGRPGLTPEIGCHVFPFERLIPEQWLGEILPLFFTYSSPPPPPSFLGGRRLVKKRNFLCETPALFSFFLRPVKSISFFSPLETSRFSGHQHRRFFSSRHTLSFCSGSLFLFLFDIEPLSFSISSPFN